jgi:phage shock protein C
MKRLYRSRTSRVIGGVAAGLAEYLDIDVTLMRLLFVLIGVLIPNVLLAYLLAWIIIPEAPSGQVAEHHKVENSNKDTDSTDAPAGELPQGQTAEDIVRGSPSLISKTQDHLSSTDPQPKSSFENKDEPQKSREVLGYGLIVLGGILLVQQLVPSVFWRFSIRFLRTWWPIAIIAIGLALIFGAIRGR